MLQKCAISCICFYLLKQNRCTPWEDASIQALKGHYISHKLISGNVMVYPSTYIIISRLLQSRQPRRISIGHAFIFGLKEKLKDMKAGYMHNKATKQPVKEPSRYDKAHDHIS